MKNQRNYMAVLPIYNSFHPVMKQKTRQVLEINDEVKEIIADKLGVNEKEIKMESTFEDLGADSLDIVELTMAIEEEFSLPEVSDDDLKKIVTVGDLVEYVSHYVQD